MLTVVLTPTVELEGSSGRWLAGGLSSGRSQGSERVGFISGDSWKDPREGTMTGAEVMHKVDLDGMRAAVSSGLQSVLGTEVPTNTPLMSVGLDSIGAVEFANAVSSELGMSFSAVMLFDHPTLESIGSYLAEESEQESSGRDC